MVYVKLCTLILYSSLRKVIKGETQKKSVINYISKRENSLDSQLINNDSITLIHKIFNIVKSTCQNNLIFVNSKEPAVNNVHDVHMYKAAHVFYEVTNSREVGRVPRCQRIYITWKNKPYGRFGTIP